MILYLYMTFLNLSLVFLKRQIFSKNYHVYYIYYSSIIEGTKILKNVNQFKILEYKKFIYNFHVH